MPTVPARIKPRHTYCGAEIVSLRKTRPSRRGPRPRTAAARKVGTRAAGQVRAASEQAVPMYASTAQASVADRQAHTTPLSDDAPHSQKNSPSTQGSQGLDEEAWQRVDVRDGSKGPLVVEVVKRRVVSRTHRRQQGDEELPEHG